MARIPVRSPWKFVLVISVLASLIFQLNGPFAAASALSAPSSPIIINQPSLTPPYNSSDPCASWWYKIPNNLGQDAYLTPNVENASGSFNSGVWRPNLPQSGVYEVEAYIPAHSTIDWNCPGRLVKPDFTQDTSKARYQIYQSSNISSTVTIDQDPLSDQWVSLGWFFFTQGTTGYVRLADLTGEPKFTRTVSLSAMRFTYHPEKMFSVFLPTGPNRYPYIHLDSAWTAASGGHREQSFFPGETMEYVSSGSNTMGQPSQAQFTWSVAGPCDALGTNASTRTEIVTLQPGTWSHTYPAVAPSCTGYFTYTLQLTHGGLTTTQTMPFVVSNPGDGTRLSVDPSFDRCTFPTTSMLQNWWVNSPYRVVNMYIGGASRGCGQPELTRVNVQLATGMGWTLIPTWVGPQAPCSLFSKKFSFDAATAYTQGRAEASAAMIAASDLGLPRDTVIYYDLESYGLTATTACRNAVKHFMNGWVERMHERSRKAGAYGSPSGSHMDDWWSISNVPDYVWIAAWYQQPYQYRPDATVWTSSLPNSMWGNHQRIRQYTNSHTETWGGLPLTIDSNINDGVVAAQLNVQSSSLPSTSTDPQSSSSGGLHGAQLLASGSGWALASGRLLWTDDSGQKWADITPTDNFVESAFFLDNRSGWLVDREGEAGALQVLHTSDGGGSWQPLLLPDLGDAAYAIPVSMQFVDAKTGWITLQHPSSSNFSLGSLLRTTDGGASWELFPMPLGEPARFLDAQRGWTVGGPAENEIYATVDGGRTWSPVSLPSALLQGLAFPGLPVFRDGLSGLLPVVFHSEKGARLEIFETRDAGITWHPSSQAVLNATAASAATPLAAFAGANRSLVASPGEQRLLSIAGGKALPLLSSSSLPEGALSLEMTLSGLGWMRASSGDCTGVKESASYQCVQRSGLWLTTDGGLTWTEVTPD